MTAKERKKAERVKEIMRLLDCSEEDALDVVETDEISAVNERTAKNQAENKRGKVRAENPTKSGIISNLAEFLNEMSNFLCENVEITNKERQIAFTCGENSYELTLVQKRKPKK